MNHQLHGDQLLELINTLAKSGRKGIYIQIGGDIGAGKSTLIKKFSKICSKITITVPEINLTNPEEAALVKNFYRGEVDKGVFQATMLTMNVRGLLGALNAVEDKRYTRVILQDRGLKCVEQFMTFPSYEEMNQKKNAAALRMILNLCTEIQQNLFKNLELKHYVWKRFFLHADESKCKERRRQRLEECNDAVERECRKSEIAALDDDDNIGKKINEHLLRTAFENKETHVINVTNMTTDEIIKMILEACLDDARSS